jgi:type IV pilus assembly protein PilN
MRFDINLASQPYEDARQFWMRWGTALGAGSLFTLVLLTLTVVGWFNARRDHQTIAGIRAEIADRDQRRMEAERFLGLPENRTTRDESQVLNELIERKAFSWTLVLENLEKVMPGRVHLVSIHPELDSDNQLALKMTVAGDSRDRAIELARRMEDSRRFAQTNIISERSTESKNGDTEQFDIAAVYIPETLPEAGPGTSTNAKHRSEDSQAGNTKTEKPRTAVKKPTPRGSR